ncbi:MAG: outer membrane beta-barrel protein [Sideroxyarcus sp.]
MKKVFAVALLSTVFASPVIAAEKGFYVGANLGQAKASGNLVEGMTASRSDTYMGILGGYQFNRNLAAEVQYVNFGKLAEGSASAKTSGMAFTAVGILPINEMFSVFGKLGVSNTSLEISNPVVNETVIKTAITYGLGGQYSVNNAWGIRAGVDWYSVGQANSWGTDGTYTVVSAGVVYKF